MSKWTVSSCFVFFNDTATTEIYTLSLHDALPIWSGRQGAGDGQPHALQDPARAGLGADDGRRLPHHDPARSEEHTSELQSRQYLVCRLLLEKKKQQHLLTPHGDNHTIA